MPKLLQAHDRHLVVGVTGAGKTWYTQSLVNAHPRVIVWDIHDEYGAKCSLDRVTNYDLEKDPDLIAYAECRLAVRPVWEDTEQLADELRTFCRILKADVDECLGAEEPLLHTLLVIEECAAHRPQGDGTLSMLAMQARHWNMPLVLVSQRIMGIPPNARSQATRIVSFLQTEPDDLQELSKKFGERTSKISRLQRGKPIIWDQSADFSPRMKAHGKQ